MNPTAPSAGGLTTATSAGGYTNANAGAVESAVQNIGPFATSYRIPTYNTPQILKNAGQPSSPSNIDAFFGKIGSVFKESAHLIEGAGQWLGRQAVSAAEAPINFGDALVHMGSINYEANMVSQQVNQLSQEGDQIQQLYRSGAITKQEFMDRMNANVAALSNANKQANDIAQRAQGYKNMDVKGAIGTISDLLMFTGAGVAGQAANIGKAGVADAASFLMGDTAKEAMTPVENFIARMAANKAEFGSLSQATQSALKASVTDSFMRAGSGMTAAQIARATAVNLALKYPITFNWMNGTGDQVYKELQSGKYGDAIKTIGFNAALILAGGPIGHAFKYGGDALHGLSGKLFGSTSFLDEYSKAAGLNPSDIYNAIKDNPEAVRAYQALEATNKAAENGRVISAVNRIVEGMKNYDPTYYQGKTADQIVAQDMKWYKNQGKLTTVMTKKVGAANARKYVLGRWGADTKGWAANEVVKPAGEMPGMPGYKPVYGAAPQVDMTGAPDFLQPSAPAAPDTMMTGFEKTTPPTVDEMLQNWENLKIKHPDASFSNSDSLDGQVKNIIRTSGGDTNRVRAGIQGIEAQTEQNVPKALAKELAADGFVAIAPNRLEAPFVEGNQKLLSSYAQNSEFFQRAIPPAKILGGVGDILTRAGLSPERSQITVHEMFTANLAKNLQGVSYVTRMTDPQGAARGIISKLTDYINTNNEEAFRAKISTHPPITDFRQLTRKEITTALGTTEAQAGEIQKAMMQSMFEVPLSVRGIADHSLDYVYTHTSALAKYMRVQGAGRFAYNPFFKMKLAAKTEILSSLEGRGYFGAKFDNALSLITGQSRTDLRDVAQTIEQKGLFTSGYSNEAYNETTAIEASAGKAPVSGLIRSQKLSVAALVSKQAERVGMSVPDFIDNNPNAVRDTIESIVHYNPNASFLNSPLARTLNFAVFPFRFNLKVGTFMARALAKQGAITQIAVINGLMDAHKFLTSTEGQIWYSQNADVLGLLSYFTPIETLSAISNLGHIGPDSIGGLGELGGLPAGFILQILQAEGFDLNMKQAYLNPKTGQPSVNYIPNTAKAKLATAISSFLGSIFTYPGSEAGLPSKTSVLTKLGEGLTGAKSTEWTKAPETNLTPAQQQFQQAVTAHQNAQMQAQQAQFQQPAPTTYVPQTASGTAQPYYRKTGTSTPPPTKLKKGQEPIQLLPGQTMPGQIL